MLSRPSEMLGYMHVQIHMKKMILTAKIEDNGAYTALS